MSTAPAVTGAPQLRRALTLWNLVIIGMVIVQPIAPMGIYGVISNKAGGHVVTTILIAMVAMLFTAISYGKMARAYPSAGSAYTYVGKEIHHGFGYLTGWAMVMDYILNPLICTIICAKLTQNILPSMPYALLAVFYAGFFTSLNLRGVKTSARINEVLAAGMSIVVVIFFAFVIRFLWGIHQFGAGFFTQPFYNPATFNLSEYFSGHFDRGADLHRLRRHLDIFGRGRESSPQYFAGHRAGLRHYRRALGPGSLRGATGMGFEAVCGRQGRVGVSVSGAANRRIFPFSVAELYRADCQYWFGNGLADGGRAAVVWHGPQRCAAEKLFWEDFALERTFRRTISF